MQMLEIILASYPALETFRLKTYVITSDKIF